MLKFETKEILKSWNLSQEYFSNLDLQIWAKVELGEIEYGTLYKRKIYKAA